MEANRKKIVLIGAGSAVFTHGLVNDMVRTQAQGQGPWELGLVDVNPEALETAMGLAHRMLEAKGATLPVTGSTDRRDILPGADIVAMTVGVGGRRAWETDVFIPRKYGIYQPVGDTAMPGGISRAMRMIPALVDIANDVKKLCPQALFINYSNPMTANCWAIREATGVPVIGLCHGLYYVEGELAQYLGIRHEEMTTFFCGLNHLTFILDIRHNGRDMMPVLRQKLMEERAKPFYAESFGVLYPPVFRASDNPLSFQLFESYGAYPACHDRHVTEFFPERFPAGHYPPGKQLGVNAFSFEQTIARGDGRYTEMRAQALGQRPLDDGFFNRTIGEHEQLMEILLSMDKDLRHIFSANLPNCGAVPNLPADAILELPCSATATGLRPLQVNDFPDVLAGIITRRLAGIRLTVAAALNADRKLLVEALLVDGAVTDRAVAQKLSEELLQAHKPYLPQWF